MLSSHILFQDEAILTRRASEDRGGVFSVLACASGWCQVLTHETEGDLSMPIEFRCTQCDKLLRTGDDTAGKQAKCPECGSVMSVPMPDQTPTPPSQPMGSFAAAASPFGTAPAHAPPDSINPYQSPAGAGAEPMAFALAGEIIPTKIEFGETLSRTWTIFSERWTTMVVATIIAALLYVPVYIGFIAIQLVVVPNLQDQALGLAINLLGQVVFQVFVLWLWIGFIRFTLPVVRGEETRFGLIFGGGRYLLPIILCAILTQIIVLLGFVMLIIPGMIFALMFIQAQPLIIDRNLGVIEAMSTSRDVMVGNKMTVFGLGIVVGVLGYLFSILTCFLGFLGFIPYMVVMHIVIYLGVTGRPTMADRYMMPTVESGGSPFGQPTPPGDSPFGS